MPPRGMPFATLAAALVATALAAAPAHAVARGEPQIAILCYHEVSPDAAAPRFTVSPDILRRQLRECRRAGWTFVSLAELVAKRDRPWELPKRTMVVTFDDGYRSFVTQALPVLRAEHAKPTLSVISAFIDQPPADLPAMLDWETIAELDRSGDAEIASHSHDLHRWIASNPQGDTAPALATRRWLGPGTRYENREEYRSRIHADLTEAQRVMTARLGHPVPVLTWPYGLDNDMAQGIAAQLGFRVTLALGARLVTASDLRDGRLARFMVTRDMRFDTDRWLAPAAPHVRAVGIDLDRLYDPDDAVFRKRIDRVAIRARNVGATHAVVGACSDSAGHVLGAWFPGHQLATRADVWSMVAAKLAHAGLRVWARAPIMNLTWVANERPEWRLPAAAPAGAWPDRLSPEVVEARRAAVDFYTDLAVYLPIDGILFDGDARIDAGERLASAAAADPAAQAAAIRQLVDDCKAAVRAWRPECRFGRTIDLAAADAPGIHAGSSQDLEQGFADGDLTVLPVPAPGASVGAGEVSGARRDPKRVGEEIARRVVQRWRAYLKHPGVPAPALGAATPPPVLLELHAVDDPDAWSPPRSLAATISGARRGGIASFGVHPLVPNGPALDARLLDGRHDPRSSSAPAAWGQADPYIVR